MLVRAKLKLYDVTIFYLYAILLVLVENINAEKEHELLESHHGFYNSEGQDLFLNQELSKPVESDFSTFGDNLHVQTNLHENLFNGQHEIHDKVSSAIDNLFKTPQDEMHDVQADSWKAIKTRHGSYSSGAHESGYGSELWHKGKKGFSYNAGSGACDTRLSAPFNSKLTCSLYSGCRATCMRDYQFPNGDTEMFFYCDEGTWRIRGSKNDSIPQCYPTCLPPCQNNGTCISPNTCNCNVNFFGAYCQYKRKPCFDFPPLPNNAKRICNSESCTMTCFEGHKFPDGSAVANVFCRDGEWTPGRPTWTTIPDCKPTCDPPCLNGGNCLSHNMCQCPQQFRGSQCQYSADACDARKLNFNGNYNCSSDRDSFWCSVSCPPGMMFQETPANHYRCDYAVGIFSPDSVPQCFFGDSGEFYYNKEENINFSYHDKLNRTHPTNSNEISQLHSMVNERNPTSGSCFVWDGAHYKTFDGRIVSFKSTCLYTLVTDNVHNMFHIRMSNNGTPAIIIYIADTEYKLKLNNYGKPVVETVKGIYNAPAQLNGLKVDMSDKGDVITATITTSNIIVRWDTKGAVEITLGKDLWNKTSGLCGVMDGDWENDLDEFHDSIKEFSGKWRVDTVEETCYDNIDEVNSCNSVELQQAAHEFCNKILVDRRFDACRKVTTARDYYEACVWDFCAYNESQRVNFACVTISMFVHDCTLKSVTDVPAWRDQNTCPLNCNGGQIFMPCGPVTEPTCQSPELGNALSPISASNNVNAFDQRPSCREGCFCPPGTFTNTTHCLLRKDCPCVLRGKQYNPGDSVPNDCNTCTCVSGKWSCTDIKCLARCEAIGDPHYTTFDGRHYNFMGKCSYFLVKGDNYSIEATNIACDGRISENFGFTQNAYPFTGTPSCTKTVTIKLTNHDGKESVIKLKQEKQVTVDNEDQDILFGSLSIGGLHIRHASSIFIQVYLPNGLIVWWDGQTRVYVDAPPSLQGKTKGLCGTFTSNQGDDFLTPEGDVEQDPVAFANKWRTQEQCDSVDSVQDSHPCDINVQNKPLSEEYCNNITSRLFVDCHSFVDPMPYYDDCLYDMCSCKGKVEECLCPVVAAYAKQCSHQGAIIEWRSKIRKCGLQCPAGQEYQMCGDSCGRTCRDISYNDGKHCTKQCVEGCNCPEGRALNDAGECILVSRCPCLRDGMPYPPGHKDIQPGTKGLQFCTCNNAVWHCRLATKEEVTQYPNEALEIKKACSAERHQVFTHCLPPVQVTCKNMHARSQFSSAICHSGCVCGKGFVLDSLTKECVRPESCPCHHGGKSYNNGDTMQESCNTCSCVNGNWECSNHTCPGVCTTWGDSHFKTFDNRIYDFQGTCNYLLAKGFLTESETFSVTIEIVPCGTTGASCPKSVTVNIGGISKGSEESVTFSSGISVKFTPDNENKRIVVRKAGLFVFADVADLGIVVKWDKGTHVSLRADPKWKGRVEGLCGNYNDNERDDFKTPSGGIAEVSAQLFGDSWKLQAYCPEATPVKDTCSLHPSRKTWSLEKCSILKSPIFRPCHSEVPVGPYVERCIFDTCACDQGGDCECLCTAIGAYAQECNEHGVPIKWRTQEFCAMQCDERCSEYKPCVQTCPIETCDNMFVFKTMSLMCGQDTCVEGCDIKPCPTGEIYNNTVDMKCVPTSACKPFCLNDGKKDYFEGDLMEEDACHSCYCSRHQKTCTGQPCTEASSTIAMTTLSSTTTPLPLDENIKCLSGWTPWLNRHHPDIHSDPNDVELLPTIMELDSLKNSEENTKLGVCSTDKLVDINCRDATTHKHYKDGHDVVCTLEQGLLCNGTNDKCPDYEIRVLCDCGETTTSFVTEASTLVTSIRTISTTGSTTILPELERCNKSETMMKHTMDCTLYYECAETENGVRWLERICPSGRWFNPNTMSCDIPSKVVAVRPDCDVMTETINRTTPCADKWSDWIDISNPETDNGDFELLSSISKKGVPACDYRQIVTDIECQFQQVVHDYKHAATKKGIKSVSVSGNKTAEINWIDYIHSPDVGVTCLSDLGLECDNKKQRTGKKCHDYRIRVFCSCDKEREDHRIENPTVVNPNNTVIGACRADEQYSECSVHCEQVCLYYGRKLKKRGMCAGLQQCVPGCISKTNEKLCPTGSAWRDYDTCVPSSDCTCSSHSGRIVKPGEVVHESECEICQCVSNHYVCDKSSCGRTTNIPVTEMTTATPVTTESLPRNLTTNIIIITSTSSPPSLCDENRLVPVLRDLPDNAFTASSSESHHEPQHAKISNNFESYQGWKPLIDNNEQYLQIDLGEIKPLYSVVTKGNLFTGEIVTSYNVLYSDDGFKFSYVVGLDAQPQVFRGPVSSFEPAEEKFRVPIEAKYVRVIPKTWKDGITLSVEFTTCGNPTTATEEAITTTIATTTMPVCVEEMGLRTGQLQDVQVTVSSSTDNAFKPQDAALDSNNSWIPVTNSPHQWIQFDWLEERTVTGLVTKGGRIHLTGQPAWVEVYKIAYSHDGKEWSYILDDESKHKIFVGNFDADTPHKNLFKLPIHTQYVRLYPIRWENSVALRIEMLGCFIPYPEVTTEVQVKTTATTLPCNVCPGVTSIESCLCSMELGKWWDGEQCVIRAQCPCIVGHITYAIGTVYDTEECEKCTCTLAGVSECAKKKCDNCPEGLQSVMTSSCSCTCEPCPLDHKLCRTSNICIKLSQWCDGYVDCPDDEINCTKTTIETTTTKVTSTTIEAIITTKTSRMAVECPPMKCPEGFLVKVRKPTELTGELNGHGEEDMEHDRHSWMPYKSTKWSSLFHGRDHFRKTGVKTGQKTNKSWKKHGSYYGMHATTTSIPVQENVCPEFECVIEENKFTKAPYCIIPKCPDGYEQIRLKSGDSDCPEHSCVLREVPDGVCNVTGRTFNTFDGTEFKYDICNHTLSQDITSARKWQVRLLKSCTYVGGCKNALLIKNFNDTLELFANLSIVYNGFAYSVPQMEKIGTYNRRFAMKLISNKFIIFVSMLNFTVMWESNGNVKLILPGTAQNTVEGLCGTFDGKPETDRTKPDGTVALSSVEFGDSWGSGDKCEAKVCPVHIQNKAWEMCSAVKKPPLSECKGIVNVDRFLSQCVESLCMCLETVANKSIDATRKCRCDSLLSLVTECYAAKPDVSIANWRVVNDCPVECPAPFVYKECYNRICEVCCSDLMLEDPCPVSSDSCFPGCYCPDGYVREKDTCILASKCRDCVCDNLGKTRYITFDKNDFTFNSNCSFVLSETIPGFEGFGFKVLVNGGQCDHSQETCVKSVTIGYDVHSLEIGNYKETNELFIKVNGEEMPGNRYPLKTTWFTADLDTNKRLIVNGLAAELELVFHGRDKGLSLRLPSHIYYDKTQGLCGSCNGNQYDDFKTRDGNVTDNVKIFAQSWAAKDLSSSGIYDKNCFYEPEQTQCKPPAPEDDLCVKLKDVDLFGRCHAVVDPEPYVMDCYKGLCKGRVSLCYTLETYARECQNAGICIPWRLEYKSVCPYTCPSELEYNPCVPGCPQTCDEFVPELCPSPPGEGCVCPEGKVLLNGTCILKSHCEPCDSEGHYAGDVWHPDECTTCTCDKPGSVRCERNTCPTSNSICEIGQRSVVQVGTEADCCPKYICVPEPKTECEETAIPNCSSGQILKTLVDESGCHQYLCICIPKEECVDVTNELNVLQEPGVTAVLNETGCCPKVELICNKKLCPSTPTCPQFHHLTEIASDKCCPNVVCEPAKDRCIYEFQFGYAEKGGPKHLLPNEIFAEVKKPGDTWTDGPCLKCECQVNDLKPKCTAKLCPVVESNDFVLEKKYSFGECCPSYKKVACLEGNTNYKPGENWSSPDGDKCKVIACKLSPESGDVYTQEIIESCSTECKLGWKYIAPDLKSLKCCGECKPFGCVLNDQVRAPNTTWHENGDNCTTYSCIIVNGLPQIEKSQHWCPDLNDCPIENIVPDGCCKRCNFTAEESHNCYAEKLNLNETLNLVRFTSSEHGICFNKDTIFNFTECKGVCDSYTFYNQHTGQHDSNCQCCQATSYTKMVVPMICEDGFLIEKHMSVPLKCACQNCGGATETSNKKSTPLRNH